MSDAPAETATTETTTAETVETTETKPAETADLAPEVEKWKALAQKNESRAKANAKAAKELEDLRQSSMTELERAVAQAKAEGRAEGLSAAGSKLVDAEFRAAAAGRQIDVEALLTGLDRSAFLDDEGEADRDAITAWVDKVAPKVEEKDEGDPPFPDLGQGFRAPADDGLGSDPLYQKLKNLVTG